VHPEDHDAISAQWADVVRDRAALDVSFRVRHAASGGWHRIRMRAIPLSGSDGKPREWLAISSDLESRT
jgi:PAS domain-containing protein